jgi:enamine deaminase RidA (YjgF/YER057c/UK114 family)
MTNATNWTHGRVDYLNPDGLARNPAFTQVAVVSGPVRTIYVGGQDAITADGEIVGQGDLAAQTTQILHNIETALATAGAGLEHVVKLNILVVEGQDLRAGFGAFQAIWGDRPNPPLVTVAMVRALAQPDFLAEVEAVAVVPERLAAIEEPARH